MADIKEAKLTQTIPTNIVKDKNVKACADALDNQLKEVSSNVDLPSIYLNLDKLTSDQLDHIAYAWDASVWRQSWSIEIKRNVLHNVILEKRKRGTVGAVKAAIESIGSFSELKEWWQEEPKGIPHTFKVTASVNNYEGVIEEELQEDLFALIDDAKPVRSHYNFILNTKYSGQIGMIGNYREMSYARVKQGVLTNNETSVEVNVIAAARPLILNHTFGTAK